MALKPHLYQIRRWLLFAILPSLVAGAVAYVYEAHQPKTYQASETLYVQQPDSSGLSSPGGTDINQSMLVVPTYTQMINDPIVARLADQIMASRYPGYRLHGLTTGQPSTYASSTQLITLSVSDTDPVRAAAAARAVANAFITRINQLETARFAADDRSFRHQLATLGAQIRSISQQINQYTGNSGGLNSLKSTLSAYQVTQQSLLASYQQFRLVRDSFVNAVSVYSPAIPSFSPIAPHPSRTAVLVAFFVLLLGAAGIFLFDYFDDSLRSREEIEAAAGAPILGTVQRFDPRRLGTSLVTVREPRGIAAESYRLIRTNIRFAAVDDAPRAILVTSTSAREGKSTTAGNLARVLAEGGQRTIIVDADLRRPSLHRVFGLEGRAHGLTNILLSSHPDGLRQIRVGESDLSVIPSGPIPPNPADLLSSHRMRSVLDWLEGEADMVILDSPPVLAVADTAILASMVDGVILVVDPALTKRRDLVRAREAVAAVGGKVLGVVVNRLSAGGSYYYYSARYEYAPHDDRSVRSTSGTRSVTDSIA